MAGGGRSAGVRCAAFAVLALAGCGSGDPQADGAGEAKAAAPDAGVATAAGDGDVALRCPPEVRDDLAGPDVLGVRLGMTHAEALATVRCALGADAPVKTEARWFDRLDTNGIELGPQAFTVQQGESKPCDYQRNWQGCGFGNREWIHVEDVVTVATPGAPGHETAMVVWRSQNFREGAMPALQSVIDALVAKYGEPQHVEQSDKRWSNTSGWHELRWMRDRRGAPLADPNPLFRQCWSGAAPARRTKGGDGGTQVSWSDGCGLTIRAKAFLSGQNPGLVVDLNVAMVQQGDLYDHAEATQATLQQLGRARREAEVERAGEAADVRL